MLQVSFGARIVSLCHRQSFTTLLPLRKNLPPRPKPPPDSEIEESFLKGSGPGGQKINKTNSAVQLKHVPTGIVVKSQATRSRSQNRTHARELLAQKIDELIHGDESRSSIVGEVKRKKAASAAKKSRRKYRKLDEETAAATGAKDTGLPNDALLDPAPEHRQRKDDVDIGASLCAEGDHKKPPDRFTRE